MEDEENFVRTLVSWGVPNEIINKIQEQDIDDMTTLSLLGDSDINQIFDKLGPRLNFRAHMKEWREAHAKQKSVNELSSGDLDISADFLTHNASDDLIDKSESEEKSTH